MTSDLQTQMAAELASKEGLEAARHAALAYLDGLAKRPVYPTPNAIAALRGFVETFPDRPGGAREIVEQLDRLGSPATVATAGGRYFGFVIGGTLPAALAARWLADAWDQNSILYTLSPVNAVLEEVCESWLRDIFALPEETAAGFVNSTATAILCGLAAARWRLFQRLDWDINAKGFAGAPRLRIVTGDHTHATVMKAVALLGFGTDTVERVPVDDQGRLLVDRLPPLDDRTILILQAGNVNSGAFDPLVPLCDAARAAGAWVHIDGAFGLWAAASPRLAALCDGLGKADSWSVDAHKTLNAPYENGIVLCRDREALVAAMRTSGSYLLYSDQRDGMLYTAELSRRSRAAELWATLKALGRDGLATLVETFHDHAVRFAEGLRVEGFDILNDVAFNQVLVGCTDQAEADKMAAHIQESGESWVGGALWFGRPVLRISVCSWATTAADIDRGIAAFVAARQAVSREDG